MFHGDGWTDGQKDRYDEAFRNFANGAKNSSDTVNETHINNTLLRPLKLEVKLSLCSPRSNIIAPLILNLCTGWRWVVKLTSLPLYSLWNNPSTHLTQCCVCFAEPVICEFVRMQKRRVRLSVWVLLTSSRRIHARYG